MSPLRRFGRRAFLPALAAALLALGAPSIAADPPGFTAALDGICALGQRRSEGCDRIRAREIVDAAQPPWSAIGRLNFASTDIRSHCTAALVSDRLAATAAHCLYNRARGRWIPDESLRFVAGYQRGRGQATARVTRSVLAPAIDRMAPGFRIAPAQDWALLVLDQPLGRRFGTFPLFSGRLPPGGQGTALMPGYAALRPHVLSVARDCGTPLAVSGRLMAACSAMPGDSGAPLLWQGPGGLSLLGITSAVHAPSGGFTTDFAPWQRLREAIAHEIAEGN